jgi:hypothetical protein
VKSDGGFAAQILIKKRNTFLRHSSQGWQIQIFALRGSL